MMELGERYSLLLEKLNELIYDWRHVMAGEATTQEFNTLDMCADDLEHVIEEVRNASSDY